MTVSRSVLVLIATAFVAAGCGGGGSDDSKKSSVSTADRVAGCLEKQPEATKSACEEFAKEDMLEDDGSHKKMDMG